MEYQQLQDEIKAAMKARDNHRRDILRQVHTELKAIEVNERREGTEAEVEGNELAALIEVVLADTGASTKKDMGRVMGELTRRTGGNFDKAGAAQVLGSKLS